ncbi:hypothetical protein F2Q69_00046226 [Brassica cretica]|uniref:Uncharacterized protein n=1 Tax=Brassica cretica TaxID=69181 RepID=A0A8S9PSZ7_BRACR|nr:hypothetical protein F2Q69_00046226 [Brassica cretica]
MASCCIDDSSRVRARSLRSDRAWLELGRYVATELGLSSVSTDRAVCVLGRYGSVATARSLRIDRAVCVLGRYVPTELGLSSVTTQRPNRVRARSLCSDQTVCVLGCYAVTKPCACSVATQRSSRVRELGLCVVQWPYLSLSVADLDTCSLPLDNRAQSLKNKPIGVRFLVGHQICSASILASPSIDTKDAPSIDSPSSPRQLPLARQTDHSSNYALLKDELNLTVGKSPFIAKHLTLRAALYSKGSKRHQNRHSSKSPLNLMNYDVEGRKQTMYSVVVKGSVTTRPAHSEPRLTVLEGTDPNPSHVRSPGHTYRLLMRLALLESKTSPFNNTPAGRVVTN